MTASEHLAGITQQIQAANLRTLADNLASALAKIDELTTELDKLKPKMERVPKPFEPPT